MADIPVPRSFNQILSDQLDTLLSKLGLQKIKIGSPLLSILEAAAQSDVRSSQDLFNLLDSQSLDRAAGQALDNIAADENLKRITVSPSTGLVDFSDTSFVKISTSIFQGSAAPNAGTSILRVTDATNFPATGNLYIGRGSVNFEGPIAYTAPTYVGPYWTLSLTTPTVKFHNLGESVIWAHGGTRLIPAGTVVQTPQGNSSDAVRFSTLSNYQIEDGETSLTSVEVIAETPGIVGNVPAGAISSLASSPFPGAAVTNPLPFTNGLPQEEDSPLRERIKDARQTRAKGTALALTSGVIGITSKEDNKTVISSSIVSRQGQTTTLYIDDGLGYEETTAGIAQEILMDSALGGEQLFQLSSQRPIARAFLTTTISSPFPLNSGDKLAVKIGGVTSEHSFVSSEFRAIENATAYEVCSSINGDSTLLFSARTSANGTKVSIFSKTDTNEDIEIAVPISGNDTNTVLGFPVGINYTLRLYKNNQFLYKDGKKAIISANSQSLWSAGITSGDTLKIEVDGTPEQTVTITDADFVTNGTGFATVSSSNSLSSWITVFNAKITGITAYNSANVLTFVSNVGNNSRAQLRITGGTLVTKGMFIPLTSAVGADNDYSLDRNIGQLRLETPLVSGDSLIAATSYTRAYLESQNIPTSSVTLAGTGNLYFSVDSNATILSTGITGSTSLTLTADAVNRARYTGPNGVFGSGTAFISPGDWVIIWDPAFTEKGMFRVSAVAGGPNFEWFEVERNTVTPEVKTPTSLGIVFVRTTSQLQRVQVPAGTYSLTALSTLLNTQLIGATVSVFKNTKLRVTTNTYADPGDVFLATADIEGQKIQLPMATLVNNNSSHFAIVESGNVEVGTPNFYPTTVATTPDTVTFTTSIPLANLSDRINSGNMLVYRKRLDVVANQRYGADAHDYQVIENISSVGVITPRVNSKTSERLVSDRLYAASPFSITAEDNVNLVLDKDAITKGYNIPLYRNIKPKAGATYGSAPFEILDVDNSNATPYVAFARAKPAADTSFFNDFALYMKARGKSHSITTNKTILWRFGRYGAEGNSALLSFINPSAPSQSLVLRTGVDLGNANIQVVLPSLAERTGLNINANNALAIASNKTYTVNAGLVTSAAGTVTVTLAAAGVTNTHVLEVGDQIYQTTGEANYPAGPKKITGIAANSFSYAEAGAPPPSGIQHSYVTSKRPAGTTNTVTILSSSGTHITATIGTHIFNIGDTVYFTPGHADLIPGVVVSSGIKVLTGVGATTVTWAEATAVAAATLIAGVDYKISSGQCQKITAVFSKAEIATTNLVRVGSVVTATINTTDLVSRHPFSIGDIIYLSPGEANFPAGAKIVTGASNTTFTYVEAGLAVSNGTIQYFSGNSSDPDFIGGATPVIAGDITHIGGGSSLDSEIIGDSRVLWVSSTRFAFLKNLPSYNGNTVPKKLNSTSNLQFYPIDVANATAAKVVTFVNEPANLLSDIVSAKLVPDNSGAANDGSAQISTASQEEFFLTTNNASVDGSGSQSIESWPFFDGINFVKTTNLVSAASSTIGLKNIVSGELTAYSDSDNENMRLSPITASNLKNYLESSGSSGLFSNASVNISSDGQKVQLSSLTIGSSGCIEVTGGSGNAASASVYGTGEAIGGYSKVTVPIGSAKGLMGGMHVSVQGVSNMPKVTPWTSTNTMAIVATASPTEWLIQFNAGTVAINEIQKISSSNVYQIEKHGRFVAYIDNSVAPTALSTSISEGDWVYISSTTLSSVNAGLRQVVRIEPSLNTFWVENTDGIEETVALGVSDFVKFLTQDSMVPGSILAIGTDIFGSGNVGSFTVSRISEPGGVTTAKEFYVSGSLTTIGATTLGDNYVFVVGKEGSPIKLIKKIKTINRNETDSSFADIVFTTSAYATKMSYSAGSIITALDKLSFNTDINIGRDGYSYNTGLLAEVNRTCYGDENDPAVYPGIVASGSNVDISGPLIKRITVSLSIRLRTGVSAGDVKATVRSAVASVINSSKMGESIAISDLVTAANSIDGVLAVSMLYPTYNSTNDLIPVQVSEKALVLDVETDISVTVV